MCWDLVLERYLSSLFQISLKKVMDNSQKEDGRKGGGGGENPQLLTEAFQNSKVKLKVWTLVITHWAVTIIATDE